MKTKELTSTIHHPKMENVFYTCKLTKTWPLSTQTDRSSKESTAQRRSQEALGHSGGAAEIHSS
ncbi:unnamed protein product, partial [Cylicocyclus nassatus]